MKKLAMMMAALVAVVGLATSATAQAAGPRDGGGGLQQGNKRQGGMGMRMGAGRLEQEIVPKLKLSADQQKKWDAVNKDIKAEMEKMRAQFQKGQQGAKGERPQMSDADRQKLMAKFKGFQDKKMAILTKDQKAMYEKLMKEARDKMMKERQKGGGGAGAGGGKGKAGGGGGL